MVEIFYGEDFSEQPESGIVVVNGKEIHVSDISIIDEVKRTGLAFLCQVTNGITNTQDRQRKKSHIKRGSNLLQEVVGEDRKIVAGLAKIKTPNEVSTISELDALIDIEKYHGPLLGRSAELVLDSGILIDPSLEESTHENASVLRRLRQQQKAQSRLENMLHEGTLYTFMNTPLPTKLRTSYDRGSLRIKLNVIRQYVHTMVEESIPSTARYQLVKGLIIENRTARRRAHTEIDLLLATDYSSFRQTLANMTARYDAVSAELREVFPGRPINPSGVKKKAFIRKRPGKLYALR